MPEPTLPSWLEALLSQEEVTDICINGAEEIYIDRGQGFERIHEAWNEESYRDWVLEQVSAAGKSWDAKHPFIDAVLGSGHRLHVAFPPISRKGILFSIRRLPKPGMKRRWEESPHFEKIARAVARGESVLISGATGSGKTTLANDLLEHVPHSERIIALEDTPELAPRHPHFLSLVSRPPNSDGHGEVSLRTLLRQTLRMRPDRIVLGECRGPEVLELLQAINTGHRGALATLHANSPRDALRRAELLCLLASQGTLPLFAIRELLAVGIQWVVQTVRNGRKRSISEIWRIEGREGDTILMRPMVQEEGCQVERSQAQTAH